MKERLFIFAFTLCFVLGIINCKRSELYCQGKGKPMKKEKGKPNHLIHEKSPYLLQHAYNPVDWYPWGKEAFAKAKKEDKPIFLSIGYSTCHWCHVMERESFEDKQVAKLLNEVFVCIKVDREERPDIDSIYMQYCMAVNGSGGWPLTILMTPEKKPFFAGTYFPKNGRFGRMGLMELIPKIKALWKNERSQILQSSEKVASALKQMYNQPVGQALTKETLKKTYQLLQKSFDSTNGGFGHSPKFPTPHHLLFLLRHWKRTGEKQALEMVEKTLSSMRKGGIFDHVGYGFHRYSTDSHWLVPHFEKMLYDQAMISMAYTEAFQATKKEKYKQTAREIFTYVLRDMAHDKGGFYSAEDADSEGVEGKFYLWKKSEVLKILGAKEGELFAKVYQIAPEGNFSDEASGKRSGENIPHLKKSWPELAKELKLGRDELEKQMEKAREQLFKVREKRVRPQRDDKILTDWNGLMIASLAKAGWIFGEKKYLDSAKKTVEFILKNLRKKNGRLLHRFRKGQGAIKGYLDDYAFLIWGLLELYEATSEVRYLKIALELNGDLVRHFWDKKRGGFFMTANDGEALLARPKEIYDGAIPSGNSVAMANLLRISKITGETKWEVMANDLTKAFSKRVSSYPSGYTQLMSAVDFGLGPTYEVVLAGSPKDKVFRNMLEILRATFLPNKVLIFVPTDQADPEIFKLAPYTKSYWKKGGKSMFYVCKNHLCNLPTGEPKKVLELLKEKK